MTADAERRGLCLADAVLEPLEAHGATQVCYVADHLLLQVTEAIPKRPEFSLLPVSREDEGLAVLAGAHLGGQRGAMLMQSSGFALCSNVLGSVLVPYQIPVVMIVGLRGDLGEFNIAQVVGGQSVEPVCRALHIPYWVPSTTEELRDTVDGAAYTAFSTGLPVCIGVRRSLTR